MLVVDENHMVDIIRNECPYCGEFLDGYSINGLHLRCWEEIESDRFSGSDEVD